MKIKYVIVSSDKNRMYLDFWPVVKQLWANVINIKPILVLISDENKITDNATDIVHEIKSVEGIDTGLQAQIARMYVTKFYPSDVCLTSDIDMLPLSHSYFNSVLDKVDEGSLAILSADAYKILRFPICYNAAKGDTFNEILGLNVSFEEYCKRLVEFGWGWDTDELYFGKMVNEYPLQYRIKKFNRGWMNGIANNRIDRVAWGYDKNEIKNDGYIDCHSVRPYSQYKATIDKLIEHRTCQ
jgi:hypothetical protein